MSFHGQLNQAIDQFRIIDSAGFPKLGIHTDLSKTRQGINFVDLKDAGDPVEQAKIYSDGGADEICFLDITASNENRDTIYEVVEKTSKDFVPILLKYKTKVKPEVLIVAVTQPGGFLILKQAHEIRFAPTKETLYLDGTCTAQNDKVFWEAVKDAGNYVLMSCPYSPSVKLTELGEKIKQRYIDKFDRQPNYLPLQGYDAMISLLTAIKNAGSTDSKAIIKALQTLKIAGTRGDIEFSQEDGVWHHQWKAVPTFIFQYTKVGQSAGDAAVLFPKQFATAGIVRP